MKTIAKNMIRLSLFALLICMATSLTAQNADGDYDVITGVVKDVATNDNIVFASVWVPGTGVGTVTNSEGKFILKISKALKAEYFEISHLAYVTRKFKISESTGRDMTFNLEQHALTLKEVVIYPKEPRDLVMLALRNIKKNYQEKPEMMTGFYRESIKQKRDYISISEALVDIYKAAYTSAQSDQVKIFKGRKGTNVKKADTLMVQLQGGPQVSLMLDVVKNTDLSISLDNLDNYRFEQTGVVNIDNKLNYEISFSPAVEKTYPLYFGKLYICVDDLAITRAEFSLDLRDEDKAAQQFIQKKPLSLLFVPTATSYLVNYKEQNGKFYLNYVRIELKFKCDWKKRWFKNNYTIVSELAITDRSSEKVERFPMQEVFRSNMVFADKIQNLTDSEFWGSRNIIEPEESIEHALKKFTRSMKKQQQ